MPRYSWSYTPFDEARQPEKALKIQTWWRRMLAVRVAKNPLRTIFEGDVTGLTGLRCLVLIGVHDDVLGTWARAMVQRGPEAIFTQALGEHSTSWLVLVRKAALLLVLSLAYKPESRYASLYQESLMVLLSNENAVTASGTQGSAFCRAITSYLMQKQFYDLLRKSISKSLIGNSASLQPFLTLCTLPMSTYPENSPQFNKIYVAIFTQVLSLPLLPNRLPLDSPSPFISHILLTNLEKLTPLIRTICNNISPSSSPDLAANIFRFVSPHYDRLSTAAFASYLQLLAMLINNFNSFSWSPSSVSPVSSRSQSSSGMDQQSDPLEHDLDCSDEQTNYEDSELEDDDYVHTLDVTYESEKWIEKVATMQHISIIIDLAQSQAILLPHLATYLLTMTATWPSSQHEIQSVVLSSSRSWMIGDLYREVVRRSPLGQEENSMIVYESASAMHWPPIIYLADLYSQALQTMDDEEFFGKAPRGPGRNPLTLGEVASFSAQLLNIVYSLYSRYLDYCAEPEESKYGYAPSDVYCSWKVLREKLLRCLLRIYARDSRWPFVPSGHWLLRSSGDLNTFIDAAITREQGSSSSYNYQTQCTIVDHQWTSMRLRFITLKKLPFAIPFEWRVSIFQHLIVNDRVLHSSSGRLNALGNDQRLKVIIRRGVVARDGFDRLAAVDLKAPLEIVITDQFGGEEEGIDGRGQFKEFFRLFSQQVLAPYSVLWLTNKSGELYPTTATVAQATEAHILNWYWFVGRIIGKAIYEGILIEVRFAIFFLSKWLGTRSYFDDLLSLDPDLYHRLLSLKNSTEGIEELSLYFTVATEESGVTKMVDLIPNGRDIAVTLENRLRYIDLAACYRFNVQLKRQSEAFLRGLSELIQLKWLKMFNQRELQMLISGTVSPIDFDDLRRHTTYGGIYHSGHETIVAFWRVVDSFHRWQKHILLHFLTSCSRPHVLGFKELVPNFSIRDNGSDEDRLPTATRSINLLKLPVYKSERILREMLLEAITHRAGFDSS